MKHYLLNKLLLILLLQVISITASAYSFEVDGIYYNVSGSDATVTYYSKSDNANAYSGKVIIPQEVTYSGMTFKVTSIGEYAFNGCSGLTSVTIPNSVTNIGNQAFVNCSGLTTVTIPNSVRSMGTHVFYGCTNLSSVTMSNSVSRISEYMFAQCSSLNTFTIPNSVKIIEDHAFFSCEKLTSIVIPISVTTIRANAFAYCSSLTSVSIPFSVTSIGGAAFAHCTSLTSVIIPSSVTSIDYVFEYCFGLTNVTIPNSMERIGSGAFLGCSGLTNVEIPNSVKSIGASAFNGCSGLNSVTIPNSVTSIEGYAFKDCSGLTTMTIPKSVVNIERGAFSSCTNLKSINISEDNPNYSSINGIVFNKDATSIIEVPAGLSNNQYVIPNFVTSIGSLAFDGCTGLTSVTIPNSVTNIGNNAFQNCSGLTSVTIPNSVTSIGDYAFYGCYMFEFINKSNCKSDNNWMCSIIDERINDMMIKNHELVRYVGNSDIVTIPNSVTSIVDRAFSECSGLTSITIPNSVTNIGNYAFSECTGLTSITIGNSVTSIGNSAFSSCTGLTSVIIPNSVTSIDEYAFLWCTGLTSVTIPNSVTSIGSYAFDGCKLLSNVYFNGTKSEWNSITGHQYAEDNGRTIHYITTPISSITLNATSATLQVGDTKQLTATILPENASENSVTWTSSNTNVVDFYSGGGVDVCSAMNQSNNTIVAKAPGTATITCSANDGSGITASCEVTVNDVPTPPSGDDTDISNYANILYINKVEGEAGKQATLSLNMKNAVSALGYECNIYLPDGMTFAKDADGAYMATLSTERTTATKTNYFDSALQSDGSLKILCSSTKGCTFSGNDGEVATVVVNIPSTMEEGDYPIIMKSTEISDDNGKGYEVAYVKSTLSVTKPQTPPTDPDIEESTDVSQYPIALYINDVESRAGDLNLELNMKCEEENITAYQCDVYLPEGVTWKYTTDKRGKVIYDLPTFNEDRTDDSYHTITPIAKMADGSYSIIVYSMNKEYILDTDGVLMYLPLEISDEMEAGDYNIIMKNIVLTDVDKNQTMIDKMVSKLTIPSYTIGDVNGDTFINVTDIVGIIDLMRGEGEGCIREAADVNGDGLINVTDIVGLIDLMRGEANKAKAAFMTEVPSFATMAKGVMAANEDCDKCNLEVIPFTVANGTTASTVKLNLNNPGDEFTAFQCDVYFPEGISWATTVDKRGNVKLTQPTFDAEADRTDATYHTVDAGLNSNGSFNVVVYSMNKELILDEEGAVLDLPFAFDANLKPGVYDITLKNIVLTRQDKSDEKPADYTFSIMVGSPEDNAIALHGDFTADAIQEYNTVLAANTSVASVDLSEAKAVNGTKEITTGNENAVIYVAEGVSVKNTKNVVAGNTCQNLVLNDAYDFSAPKSFTAVNVNYNAAVSSSLGYKTLVLPYNCAVPSGFEAYEVGSLSGNTLSLVQVESITANKPVILKNAGTASLSATNVTVNATAATLTNGKLVGTYTNIPAPVGSYVLQNQGGNVAFYQVAAGKQPVVGPFRAYLEASEAGARSALMIGDGATALLDTKSGALSENVEGVFNAAGVRKTNITDGVNIIRTADGEVKKVMK